MLEEKNARHACPGVRRRRVVSLLTSVAAPAWALPRTWIGGNLDWLDGGMMTFVHAVARPERLAAVAPVVASMLTFDKVPSTPLPILIIHGAHDDQPPREGGMRRNPIVRRGQQAPFKPPEDVAQFWARANRSLAPPKVGKGVTLTTTTSPASPAGAVTELVVDAAGGHDGPGSAPRRNGNAPLGAFAGAERVREFFRDKRRDPP